LNPWCSIAVGNIHLPQPQWRCAPWVKDFIEEYAAFSNGAHDDQVDALTQALLRWHIAVPEVVLKYSEPFRISPI
jgi:predicted phage terminase large subunit-like protein